MSRSRACGFVCAVLLACVPAASVAQKAAKDISKAILEGSSFIASSSRASGLRSNDRSANRIITEELCNYRARIGTFHRRNRELSARQPIETPARYAL